MRGGQYPLLSYQRAAAREQVVGVNDRNVSGAVAIGVGRIRVTPSNDRDRAVLLAGRSAAHDKSSQGASLDEKKPRRTRPSRPLGALRHRVQDDAVVAVRCHETRSKSAATSASMWRR